jgi:hypothetical protein
MPPIGSAGPFRVQLETIGCVAHRSFTLNYGRTKCDAGTALSRQVRKWTASFNQFVCVQ